MIRTLVACAALALVSAACAPSSETAPSAQVVELVLRHSHFEPALINVRAGVPVTFVLKNVDPIDHEWMIGDDAFHQ